MKYQVEAHRSGGWWAIEFPDEPRLLAQARRLEQVPEVAAQALNESPLDVTVHPDDIEVTPILPDELNILTTAVEQREAAERANAAAQAITREAAAVARNAGLTVRDTGTLLGVTSAYIARITNP